mmetsp:Transcript_19326/g.46379  ORF Transcript_19326/g.46379 Transcript_19326/m.46379 type:complete len:485 (+) Transcript_19326:1816-3270(+)
MVRCGGEVAVRILLEDSALPQPVHQLRLGQVVKLRAGLDLVVRDVVVHSLEQLGRQVAAPVDPAVVAQELLARHLVLHLARVRVGVEHDHGEAQHVRRVLVGEHTRVLQAVLPRELAHDPVDLLRLARQAERREEAADRLDELHAAEVEVGGVRGEDLRDEIGALAEVLADPPLGEAFGRPQVVGDCLGRLCEQLAREEVLHARRRLLVELAHTQRRLLVDGCDQLRWREAAGDGLGRRGHRRAGGVGSLVVRLVRGRQLLRGRGGGATRRLLLSERVHVCHVEHRLHPLPQLGHVDGELGGDRGGVAHERALVDARAQQPSVARGAPPVRGRGERALRAVVEQQLLRALQPRERRRGRLLRVGGVGVRSLDLRAARLHAAEHLLQRACLWLRFAREQRGVVVIDADGALRRVWGARLLGGFAGLALQRLGHDDRTKCGGFRGEREGSEGEREEQKRNGQGKEVGARRELAGDCPQIDWETEDE